MKSPKISGPNLVHGFPGPFGSTSKEENYVLSIFYFIEWTAKGGGGVEL